MSSRKNPSSPINLDVKKASSSLRNHEIIIKGIPSSPGISFGKAVVIDPESAYIPSDTVAINNINEEIERFESAMHEVVEEFSMVIAKVKSENINVVAVLETNMLMLTDPVLIDSVKNRIKSGYSVETSVIQELDFQKHFLSLAKDSLLRERAIELDHLKERLLAALRNRCIYYAVARDSVVIAQSVTPSDIVNFKESGVLAIITEVGGISSHSSILARSFEIPQVIGVKDATQIIKPFSPIIVDGYTGTIRINPNKVSVSEYNTKKSKEEEHRKLLGDLIKLPSETNDGKRINLHANVDFPEDVNNAIMVGAEGIGLVRSEHLVIEKKSYPGEKEQFKAYNEIAERSYPNPVTFRAFDIGSDKVAAGIPKHEANPALGFRGIRFLLHRKDIFKAQIKAILRASANKNVKLLLPMITSAYEVVQTLQIVDECKEYLRKHDIPFDNAIPIGVMIETPAAAILADKLAQHVQFFSIGTNDLTQYTLAADRTNELVAEHFDAFHPAVMRLIKMTIDVAKQYNIPVGICGELAGHAAATTLLIGMGIEELSVSPSILLELKNRIRSTNYAEAQKFAEDILNCQTYREMREKLFLA